MASQAQGEKRKEELLIFAAKFYRAAQPEMGSL